MCVLEIISNKREKESNLMSNILEMTEKGEEDRVDVGG